MGLLVDGVWQDDVPRTKDGHFIRQATRFRNWVTSDGSPGPSGDGGYKAEPGRYHLYVSLACPWASRAVIFRKLKGLEDVISLSVVSPCMLKDGWTFNKDEGSTGDSVNGKSKLSEIYVLADPRYTGRVTVPVLWDKTRNTIVNNESAEIIRMLNSAFDAYTNIHTDYYPENLRSEIDESTTWSIGTSTTAFIAPDSRPHRRPMNWRSATCSIRSTRSSRFCRNTAFWSAT